MAAGMKSPRLRRICPALAPVLALSLALSSAPLVGAAPLRAPAAADSGLFQPDSAQVKWAASRASESAGVQFVELSYRSQSWKGGAWEHSLVVFWPNELNDWSKMVLVSVEDSGDYFSSVQKQLADGFQGKLMRGALAGLGAPIAILTRVPPSSQLGIDGTDKIIGHTLRKFIETGDPEWPLLVPMTRAILGAMDSLQGFVLQEKARKLDRFLLMGGSKTAWASWLAAAHDSRQRVVGLGSLAFNVLNFERNLMYQREIWGRLSEKLEMAEPIADALVKPSGSLEARRARELIRLIDPYHSLAGLRVPKLLVSGANDPYFPSDSDRFYWSELEGSENHRLYLPNFGHNGAGGKAGSLLSLLSPIQTFVDICFSPGKKLPRFESQVRPRVGLGGFDWLLSVTSQERPANVVVWRAESASRDFRKSSWSVVPGVRWDEQAGALHASVDPPQAEGNRFVGAFAEIHWKLPAEKQGGLERTFVETTEVSILGPSSPPR
jgi:PhoPQ-activated pathogenicity-related protein